jgi:hypothetical protein
MKRISLVVGLLLGVLPSIGLPHACLRIMTPEELSRKASFIARIKVFDAGKANFDMYFQLATAKTVDVMEGDSSLKQVSILARSGVQCAQDQYAAKQEMLVFLVPEGSLFKTLNFQYGQFQIEGEIVKGWRDKANKPVDKPYADVRKEIEAYVDAAHTPPAPREGP